MKILVCGGDERSVHLARLLHDDGHEAACFCLDRAELPAGCHGTAVPVEAEAVILPVPAEDAHGFLNAPLGALPCRIEHILDCAGSSAAVIGGGLSAGIRAAAAQRGMEVYDYMRSPCFTARNAAITAEGAVSELMKKAKTALCDMRILVIGWGRIGKLLINKLHALCPALYLMSKNSEARALARELGCAAIAPDCPPELLGGFDAVINTAPAPVIADLRAFRDSCILLELASAPGGIDASCAENCGLELSVLRGLPGRYAPESAARTVHGAVSEILKASKGVVS